MDFGLALTFMRSGQRIARTGWNGRGMWLEIQTPDEKSKMSQPYIFITTGAHSPLQDMRAPGVNRVPWLASQTDLLAYDWYVL